MNKKILIGLGIAAVVLISIGVFWYWKGRKEKECNGDCDHSETEDLTAETTQVTVVDPSNGAEIIASDFGEDSSSVSGKIQMQDTVEKLAEEVAQKVGAKPTAMKYKVYNNQDQLIKTGNFTP